MHRDHDKAPVLPVSEFATNSTCFLCGMCWQPGIVGFFPVTYISLYKIYKPKVNFASTSVGKTQSGCLLSVTGYQYAYRYILLSDLKTKHYMPYLSCTVTHIFSVDYWRNIECALRVVHGHWKLCLTRDTDIANLSVWHCVSVRPSVCLSVHDVPVSDENGLTYCHSFFTIWQPNYSSFISMKHLHDILTGSPPAGVINTGGV